MPDGYRRRRGLNVMMIVLNILILIITVVLSIMLNGLKDSCIILAPFLVFPSIFLFHMKCLSVPARWAFTVCNVLLFFHPILRYLYGQFGAMSAILFLWNALPLLLLIKGSLASVDKLYWNILLTISSVIPFFGYVVPMSYALLTWNALLVDQVMYWPLGILMIQICLFLFASIVRICFRKRAIPET